MSGATAQASVHVHRALNAQRLLWVGEYFLQGGGITFISSLQYLPPSITKDQLCAVSTFFYSIGQSWDSVPTPAWYLRCSASLHEGSNVLPIRQPLNFNVLLVFLGVLQLCLLVSEPIHHCIRTDPNYSF